MIIKARFRKAHGIVSHLLDDQNNGEIILRNDLARFAPHDLDCAVRGMVTIAESNRRAKRHILEIIIAPRRPIHEDQLEDLLKRIDVEFQLPPENGRIVMEHEKGARGNHFHVIYGFVNPDSGLALNSWRTFQKSEFLSRHFELQNGLPIEGQKISDSVVQRLRGLGFQPVTENQTPRRGERVGRGNRRQLERMQRPVKQLCEKIGECWREAANDDDFRERLKRNLLFLAVGDKTILVVTRKGAQVSLVRSLRQDARDRGVKSEEDFNTRDINARFANERDLESMLHILKHSDDQFVEDLRKLRMMLTAKFQASTASYIRGLRIANDEKFKEQQKSVSIEKRRDDLRQQRVHRAFAAAEVSNHPDWHRIAMIAVGVGILVVGGGLGLALLSAGVAASAMPSRELAQAIALAGKLERKTQFNLRQQRLQDAYSEAGLMTESPNSGSEMETHFKLRDPAEKVLVGLFAHLTLQQVDRFLTVKEMSNFDHARIILGPSCCSWVERILHRGGCADVMQLIRAYDHDDQRHSAIIGKLLAPREISEGGVELETDDDFRFARRGVIKKKDDVQIEVASERDISQTPIDPSINALQLFNEAKAADDDMPFATDPIDSMKRSPDSLPLVAIPNADTPASPRPLKRRPTRTKVIKRRDRGGWGR